MHSIKKILLIVGLFFVCFNSSLFSLGIEKAIVLKFNKAIESDDISVVKELSNWTVNIGNIRISGNFTLLMRACMYNSKKIVKLLLESKADVNAEGSLGETPLNIACCNGFKDTAELLLKYGADIEQLDIKGTMPLISNCYKGHMSIVKLLIKYGEKTDTITSDGFTFERIALINKNYRIVELLNKVNRLI